MPAKPKALTLSSAPATKAGATNRVHALDASAMMRQLGQWRASYNPLRGLTAAVVTNYIEQSERGACADLQWLIHWVERENAVLMALEERFAAAVSDLDWDVKIPDHVPPSHRALAEAQKQTLTEFYYGMHALRKSLEELALARFRGAAFLEKALVKNRYCLDPVPPVYFNRDNFGPWNYNAMASSGATMGEPLDPERWIIREVSAPIGRIAVRLHVIRSMGLADWQGYVETFGIPAIFAIMPEGVTEGQRVEFQNIAEKIISDARGALPAGTDIKTVTGANGAAGSPFLELMDWCDKQLVLAGTGGLLTMLAESGSGTLAGGAHMEAFKLLARREAVLISECMQDQVDAQVLEKFYPGQPQYAYFELAGAEENDPDKVVQHYVALKGAGLTMALAQVVEKTGYEFVAAPAPADPAAATPPPATLPEPAPTPEPAAPAPVPAPAPALESGTIAVVENAGTPETEAAALADAAAAAELPPGPAAAPPAPDAKTLAGRKALAEALHEDFEGIRTALEELDKMEHGTPEYEAAVKRAQAMVEALANAEPGSIQLDRIFEDLAAEGILDGWGIEEDGTVVSPDAAE